MAYFVRKMNMLKCSKKRTIKTICFIFAKQSRIADTSSRYLVISLELYKKSRHPEKVTDFFFYFFITLLFNLYTFSCSVFLISKIVVLLDL